MYFAKTCIRHHVTFRCFFKLFIKKVNVEVISDKDQNFKETLHNLRAKGNYR